MRMRSSISELLPFHLRAWSSQLRTFAHPQLHTLALQQLSTLASSPYRRKCEGIQTAQTGQNNKRHLNYILHCCVPFTLDRSHIRTFAFKRRYESAKLRRRQMQSLSLNIYISENADCSRVFLCLHMKEVPKYICSETYRSRKGLCPLFDWWVIVRGNRISLL